MELFSRKRCGLVSAQLSIKFCYCHWCTFATVLYFQKHNRLPLGRYEPSSPVGYCAPHANLLKKIFLVQRTGLRKICLFGAPHRRRLKEPWLWEETHAEEVMSLNPSTDITTYMVNFSHSFLVKLYLCLKRPKKDKKRRPGMAHFQKKGAQVLKNECDIFCSKLGYFDIVHDASVETVHK